MFAKGYATINNIQQLDAVWTQRSPFLCEVAYEDVGRRKYLSRYKRTPCSDNLKSRVLEIISLVEKTKTIDEMVQEMRETECRGFIFPLNPADRKLDIEYRNKTIEAEPHLGADEYNYIFETFSFVIHVMIDANDDVNVFLQIYCDGYSYQTPPFIY